MDKNSLLYFINYGYFIDYDGPTKKIDFSKIDKTKYIGYDLPDLIKNGKNLLFNAISKTLDSNKEQVVPLSGGLDSRLILVILSRFMDIKNIKTFTFGLPNTYDFEIGNKIASEMGTQHTSFDLTKDVYDWDNLVSRSNFMYNQTYNFYNPNIELVKDKYKDCIFWSGYIGDLVSGGYHNYSESQNIDDAQKEFIKKEKIINSLNIEQPDEDFIRSHMDFNYISNKILPYYVQIFYKLHVEKLTYPNIIFKGLNFKKPLIDESWFNFISSVEDKYLINQELYKKILVDIDPKLFSLPCKSNVGLGLNANKNLVYLKKKYKASQKLLNKFHPFFFNKYLNYLDFDAAIRERSDFKLLFSKLLPMIKSRNILETVNIDEIWDKHQKGYNHSDILLSLASLEINLKQLDKK